MNNPTHIFNEYTIKAPIKSAIYSPINSTETLVIIKDSSIYAEIKFINNGLNINASKGIRLEGNIINIL